MTCLDEVRKQQIIDQHVYDQKLMGRTSKNIVIDGDTMIDRRTSEVLDPEVDSTYCKDKF